MNLMSDIFQKCFPLLPSQIKNGLCYQFLRKGSQ